MLLELAYTATQSVLQKTHKQKTKQNAKPKPYTFKI